MITQKALALASEWKSQQIALQTSKSWAWVTKFKASNKWVKYFLRNNSIILNDSLSKENTKSLAESTVPSAAIETIEEEVAEEVVSIEEVVLISSGETIVDYASSSGTTEIVDTGNYLTSKLLSIATASTDSQQKGTTSIYTNIYFILFIYSSVIARMIRHELNEKMGEHLIQRLREYSYANKIKNVDVDLDILNDVLTTNIPLILSTTEQSYDEIIFSLIKTYIDVQLEAKQMMENLEEIESRLT
jgi:hypothetical protein